MRCDSGVRGGIGGGSDVTRRSDGDGGANRCAVADRHKNTSDDDIDVEHGTETDEPATSAAASGA